MILIGVSWAVLKRSNSQGGDLFVKSTLKGGEAMSVYDALMLMLTIWLTIIGVLDFNTKK